jgi:hypothetical protein
MISLYAIKILNAIKNKKNHTCIRFSSCAVIACLQKIFFIIQLIVINTNLPPSSAGSGSKLNTPKLILITAAIININIIPADIELVMKSNIPIGPLTCSIASCLSVGVAGLNIFLTNNQIHLNVSSD